MYSIQSLSRFNGMKATSEELEKAGITKVTAAPAFLKEIAIMGERHGRSGWAKAGFM